MKKTIVLMFIVFMVFTAACINMEGRRSPEAIEGTFQVIWDGGSGLSEDLHFANHLASAYPDAMFAFFKIMRLHWSVLNGDATPNNIFLVAEEDVQADLIMIENMLAPYLFKSGYLEPLDGFLAASLDVIDEVDARLMDYAREQGDGQLYGIPFGKNVYALFYNKQIFDELQMPYPVDGMTWDEVFGLAWTMAEHPDLGKRAALRVPDGHLLYSQFHSRFHDPETGELDADSPLWARQEEVYAELRRLVERNPLEVTGNIYGHFADGKIAMIAGRFLGEAPVSFNRGHHLTYQMSPPPGDWDLVSFPVFADDPETGPAPSRYYLGIPKNSQRKSEAFQLILHLLSEEVQSENSRHGLASVLRNPAIHEAFGSQNPLIHNKNTQAFFHHPKEGTLDPAFNWLLHSDLPFTRLLEIGRIHDMNAALEQRLAKAGVD